MSKCLVEGSFQRQKDNCLFPVTDVQDIMNQKRPLPPIYKFPNIFAPRVLHGACLQLPAAGIPEAQRPPLHHDNREGWAEPTRPRGFLAPRMLRGSRTEEQCACVPPAAHAQALGGPRRSKGEFKETGATRLRLPRPGRGCRQHAGDSGAEGAKQLVVLWEPERACGHFPCLWDTESPGTPSSTGNH